MYNKIVPSAEAKEPSEARQHLNRAGDAAEDAGRDIKTSAHELKEAVADGARSYGRNARERYMPQRLLSQTHSSIVTALLWLTFSKTWWALVGPPYTASSVWFAASCLAWSTTAWAPIRRVLVVCRASQYGDEARSVSPADQQVDDVKNDLDRYGTRARGQAQDTYREGKQTGQNWWNKLFGES